MRTARTAAVLTTVVLALAAAGFLLPLDPANLFAVPIAVSFGLVGGLVAARRPQHPVGWLFLGFGFVAALNFAGEQYWHAGGELRPGSLPGASVAASVAVHTWHPGFAFFILAFLRFPDGRPLSPRWHRLGQVTAAVALVTFVAGIFEYDFVHDWYVQPPRPRPLFHGPFVPVADAVFGAGLLFVVAMFPVSAASIALRYRRAGPVVRAQIRWVAFAIILVAIALPTSVIVTGTGGIGASMLPLIPAAAGVAILRQRLFDIDRLINRTIVYALVTAVLALGYGAVVVGLGALLGLQGRASNLVVAGTTLAAAAAFRPLRDRTQRAVDRRFNRARYDAARTLDLYRGRLRDQLDLDALHAELLAAVQTTVQPATATLWLRPVTKTGESAP